MQIGISRVINHPMHHKHIIKENQEHMQIELIVSPTNIC
uniref:Uncharacterized protein n=1 Tax=Rhizophora mucronata TaxID=61149 RepID=A0A2P2NB51_RHIMU